VTILRATALALLLALVLSTVAAAEFVAQAKDFHCLLDGRAVAGKHFFVFHRKHPVSAGNRSKPTDYSTPDSKPTTRSNRPSASQARFRAESLNLWSGRHVPVQLSHS